MSLNLEMQGAAICRMEDIESHWIRRPIAYAILTPRPNVVRRNQLDNRPRGGPRE